MGKKLIIAEKPSLGRTVAEAIGEQFSKNNGFWESPHYIVSWCFGHLYELQELDRYFPDFDPNAKAKWSMDKLPFYPDNWEFVYEPKRDAKTQKTDSGIKAQIKILTTLINRQDVTEILACGDADREGEVIVRLVLDRAIKSSKTLKRLWLPALTPDAIREGISNAKDLDEYENLYQAGLTRAAMDWLVGIELTRYASLKTHNFLRIGRCVCPIVEHVVEREKAIKEFVPKPYSAIISKEETNGEIIELQSKKTFEDGESDKAKALADKYNAAGATVTDIKTERKTINPPKLFSQSDLQSFVCKADKSLTPDAVLKISQKLYEGGYITYPRTPSNYLAKGEAAKVDDIIAALGVPGVINKPNSKSIYDDSKIESHSALTPTTKTPSGLTGTEELVYNTIMDRFCAVFSEEPCTVDRTIITIQCADETFTLKGDVEVTKGWKHFETCAQKEDKVLPRLSVGEPIVINFKVIGKMTTPPKRFTVESLNAWMKTPLRGEENDGAYTDEEWKDILTEATICTEATRADTLTRCQASKYISLKKGTYYAEEAGFYLVDVMKSLGINLDVGTTVELSRNLHKVKTGERSKADVLNQTKEMIDKIMSNTQTTVQSDYTNSPHETRASNAPASFGPCPVCGKPVYESRGKNSWYCSGYKDGCTFSIWKTGRDGVHNSLAAANKELTGAMVKQLLSKKRKTSKITFKSARTGKDFDAHIVLSEYQPGRWGLQFEFPAR